MIKNDLVLSFAGIHPCIIHIKHNNFIACNFIIHPVMSCN